MDPSRPYAHRRVVWFALGVLLLFPVLIGCASSVGVDPPLDQFNIEYLRFLKLGDEGFEEAKESERRVSADGTTVAISSDDALEPESLALVDDQTLAIGTHYRMYFADISDPAEPVVISVFEHGGKGFSELLSMDGFVYGYARTAEFLAIDARQPAAPQLAFRMSGQDEDRERILRVADMPLAAEDGFLYLSMQGGIHIFNAADPYALSLEGVYYPPQTRARWPFMSKTPAAAPTARQLEAEKEHGTFFAHEDYPSESLPCSRRYIENALILGATLADQLLYVWVDKVACVGPEQEVVGSKWPRGAESPTPVYGPTRREVEDGGVWVLDVSQPSEPLVIGFLPLQGIRAYPIGIGPYGKFGVVAAGNYLYLTPQGDLRGDSTIVDISVPESPVLLGKQMNADWAVRAGNLLFVSIVHVHNSGFFTSRSYSHGLQVFDVSEAASPILIGMISEAPEPDRLIFSVEDVAFRDGYVYVAQDSFFSNGIHVLRLIDPDWRPDDAPAEAADTSP